MPVKRVEMICKHFIGVSIAEAAKCDKHKNSIIEIGKIAIEKDIISHYLLEISDRKPVSPAQYDKTLCDEKYLTLTPRARLIKSKGKFVVVNSTCGYYQEERVFFIIRRGRHGAATRSNPCPGLWKTQEQERKHIHKRVE